MPTIWLVIEEEQDGVTETVVLSAHMTEGAASSIVDDWRSEHGLGADDSWCECHGKGLTVDSVELRGGLSLPGARYANASDGIEAALGHLREARDLLRLAGAGKAADYVARSMKSADGAYRHALGKAQRNNRVAAGLALEGEK